MQGYLNGNSAGSAGKRDTLPKKPSSNLLNSSSNQMLYKDALLNSSSNNNRDLSPTHFREQQQYQQQFQYKDHQQQSPYRSSNNNNSNGIQKTPSALTDRPRTSQYTSSKEHNNSSPIRGSNYPSNLQANIQSQSSRITSLADKRENGNNSSNPLDIIQKQGLIQDSFDRTGKRTQLEEIHSNISNNNNTSNPQIQGNKLVLQQQQLLQQQQQQQQQSVRSATNKMQQLLKDMMGNDKRTSYNNGNSNNNTSASAKAISNHLNKTDNHLQQHLQQQQQQLTRGDSIGVRSRDTSAERERPTQSAKTSRSTQQNITNSGTLSQQQQQQQQLQQYQLQQQQILQSRGSISPINARSSIPSTTLHVSQQQQQQLNKQSSQGQLILPSKYAGNSNNISTNNLMSGYGNNNSNNNINNNNRNNSSKLRLQGDVIEAVYKNSNRPITPKDNRSRTPNHAMNQQGNQYINESSSHNQSEAGLSYKETFENANQTYCAGSSGNNNKAESYLEQLLLGGRTSSQHTSSQNQIYNNNNNSSKNEYSVYSKIQQQQQQNKQLSNDVNNKDVQDRRQQQQLSPLRHQMASNNNNNNVLEAGQFFERHASLQNIHHPHNGHTSSSNTSLQSALKATQNYNNIPSNNSNNNAKVQFKSNEVADSTNSNNTSYNLGKVANSNTSKIPQNIQNNSNNNDTENNMNGKQSLKQYQQIQQQPQQISGTIYSSPSATSKLSSALLAQQEKMNKLQSQQDKQNFVSSPKSTIDQQSPLYQKPIGSSQKREVLLLSEREKESKTFLAIQEQLRLKHEIQLRQQEQEQQENQADMSSSNGYGNDINRNGKKRTKKLSESLLESNYFQFTPSAVQQYQEECKAINGNASADKGQQEMANNVCYAEQQQQANRQIGGTKGRQQQQQIEVEQVQKYNQQATSTTGGHSQSNNNSTTNNDQQLRQLPKNINNINNSIPQGQGNTPTAAKDKLENKSIVKDQINISHTTNASSISTNTTSTFSEELSRSSLAKIDLKILMRVEQSLYDLSRTEIHKRKTVTGICKDYLEAIADESLDSLEKLGSDNKQSQILTRVFILERMCVVLALHESLRNTQDEQNTTNNNNINNNTNCQDSSQGQDDFLEEDRVHELVNCMQYVHLNSVLCMECVMRSQQVSSEGCVSVRRVLDQRSKKSKRIASVLAKTDKFQLMNNYSNIILPYLNNLATSQDSPTLMAIRNIIGNIPNVTLAQSTQILMDSFSKMIVDLEEKASKDSIHSNNSKSLAHDSISDASSSSSSNNSQIDISFEQRKHKDTARSPFIETNNGNNNNNTNNKNSKSNNNITNKINDKKINNSNNTNTNQAVNDSSNSNAMKKKKNNVEEYKKSETSHKRRDDNQGIKQGQQQQQDNEDEECMDDEEYNVDGEEEDEDEEDDGYDQVFRGSVKAPYLPQMKDSNKHTLVLDLDETLVHYQEIPNEGGQFLIRPNAEVFLQVMAQHYEIVIFTAAIKEYADFILDVIDNKSISHRLYRQHTSTDGRNYIKDLSKLGRDLSKILIIDNLPENFCRQPKNGVLIQSWYGEADDRALFDLIPLLTQITKNKKYRDVRDALQRYREQMMKNLLNGVQDPHIHLDLDDAENEKEGEDEEQEEEEEEEEEEDTH